VYTILTSTTLESNRSLVTMPEREAKRYCLRSWRYWSQKTLESYMSVPINLLYRLLKIL